MKIFTFIVARPTESVERTRLVGEIGENIIVLTAAELLRKKRIRIQGLELKMGRDILERRIKVNRIRCKHCRSTIRSLFTLHRVYCKCGKCSVDGGVEILIRTGILNKDYKELSEFY